MNEQAVIDNAIKLGWKDCSFVTVKAHIATDGSYCPEMRISQGKFPPNFHWAALPKLKTEQPADNLENMKRYMAKNEKGVKLVLPIPYRPL